jgi:UDP-GlcNAc:undecaprenyl-phosphate GlcNAc-1-phosphate transferase
MELSNSKYLTLFLAAFFAVALLTPIFRMLALRYGVVDSPTQKHKTHIQPIPYLGGLAIMIGASAIIYGAIIGFARNSNNLVLASTLVLPAFFLGIVGLIDDLRNLSPWPRFLAQTLAGIFVATLLIITETVGSPTGSSVLDAIITILWIVGITNSINFFDNVDGGASGTVAIVSLALFILALQGQQFLIAALAIVLAGSTIGFLVWNKPPARIYMGDAGALFLGLLLSSLVVRLDTNPINRFAAFSVPILLLAVPIMDTMIAVFSRIKRRVSPFQGGRDHLSHRLMREGLTKRSSVIALWLMTCYFTSMSLIISISPYKWEGALTTFSAISWVILSFWFFKKSAT